MTAPTTTRAHPTEVLPYGTDRDVWLAARQTGIGSSDIAAVMGQSNWASPYSVWCDKTADTVIDNPPSEAMEWGLLLEPVIAAQWARRNSNTVRRVGLCRNPDRAWQIATPDQLCGCASAGVLETKTDAGWNTGDWDEQIPLKYLLQLLWQVDCLGVDHGHLAVLLGGNELRSYDVEPNPDITQVMRDTGERFWQSVLDRTEPDVDATNATTAALKRRFELPDGGVTVLDFDWIDRLDGRETDKTTIALLEQQTALVENQLRQAMGPATHAVCAGQKVATWLPRKDGVRVLRIAAAASRKDVTS